jgi:alpha-glucosidase (family GH31 glycosyl hydrolase)
LVRAVPLSSFFCFFFFLCLFFPCFVIGSDICGFNGATNEELCARWIEVGAFYPFSRNHNAIGQPSQELYQWNSVTIASQNALAIRYQLLPYLYTLFHFANQRGETVIRSLWMNFPTDSTTLSIEKQFMWGNGILLSPVLDAGVTSVNAYFPKQLWYDFKDRSLAVDASKDGIWKTLETSLTETNVHIRGGSILPLQQAALTTTAGRKTPFTLIVALCPDGKAWGNLFLDDGEEIALENFLYVSYEASGSGNAGSFSAKIDRNSFKNYERTVNLEIKEIVIMGKDLIAPSSSVMFNNQEMSSTSYSYDSLRHSITFTGLNGLKVNQAIDLQWK